MTVQDKFQTTRRELALCLIDREQEIDLALTSLLASEHCLFVGPPGTGKSLLVDIFATWLAGSKFSYLLNRFTDPAELLGPIDIMAMKSGDYRRITANKMPEANIVFLDEVFKGSSAILNTILKILNERRFENGLTIQACPLVMAIGASNEWPTEAKELGALFDRFLFRKYVSPVAGEDNVDRLMFSTGFNSSLSTTLLMSELKEAQVDIRSMAWESDAQEAAHEIRRKLTREGVIIGDRRLRKSVHACKCFAWLNGNSEVTTDDLEVLSHIWWVYPENQPQLVADVVAEIAQPVGLLAVQLLAEANEIYTSTNMSDPNESASASKKLATIFKRLDKSSGSRVEQAKDRIRSMVKEIRLKFIESV